MDLNIKGKKALVTGASRGIGKSIAASLSKEGVKVAIVSRDASSIRSTLSEIGGKKKGHVGLSIDLMDEDGPEKLCSELTRHFGLPDIVVHNLGGPLDITDALCPIEDWRKVWRFNLEISIELNRLLVPGMKKAGWGRVIHVSSVSALENLGSIPYCSAKAALTAYAKSLGRVLAADGIVVTAVLPGAVFTEGGHWDMRSKEQPERVAKYLDDHVPMRQFARPDEISNFILFLCSAHVSQCTGAVYAVDGGMGRSYIQV